MKVEVKKIDPIKRELRFEIPKERVAKKMEEVYEALSHKVKVKGFRQGKVPRHILELQHKKTAQEEVIQKLIPEVYHEGIHQEKLEPINMPEIENVLLKDGILTFAARLEIKPEVKIKDYLGIKVHRKSSEVTEEELSKTLEIFKKTQEGGQKQTTEAAAEVVIDDAFARGLGYPSLADFKKSLTRQLEMEKDRQNRVDIENQIVTELLKKTKLTVPESLIKKQMGQRLHDLRHRLKSQGASDEEIKKREDELRPQLQEAVERDIKVYLILDKIAELEQVEVKHGENLPGKVIEFLLKKAQWA